jgi:hypothetical protein
MFAQLSASGLYNCGIKTDGTLACWGYNYFGQASPPPGTFTAVSAGDAHACAVRTDGALLCWGANSTGQATPPDNDATGGTFGGTVPPAAAWVIDGTLPEGAHTGNDFEDVNDDNDLSCTDTEEAGGNLALGGMRDRKNPWDFADVPVPALPMSGAVRDGAVSLSDVSAALAWVGRVNNGAPGPGPDFRDYDDDDNINGVEDGAEYDRTPNGQISGPPDGAISLTDVGVILAQVGDNCNAAPN